MDKRTKGVAFAGVMTAGAVISLLLGRLLPTGQAGFAALASLFAAAAVVDCGAAWGLAVWLCSSALGLLILGATPPVLLFALFFGYYPAVKLSCEKRLPKNAAWLVKTLVFYAGGTVCAVLINRMTGMFNSYGVWIIPVGIIAGGAVFVVFDIGYTKLLRFYSARLSR